MKRNLTVLLMEICSIICCYAQVSIKRDYHKKDTIDLGIIYFEDLEDLEDLEDEELKTE